VRLFANPGRTVVMVAEIALEQVGADDHQPVDCESGKPISLAELLRAFREDGDDPELGWVRITIEPFDRSARRRGRW
jgi:hypothetical protein